MKGERFYDSAGGLYFQVFSEEHAFTATVEAQFIDNESIMLQTHVVAYPGIYQYSLSLNRQSFTRSYVNFTYIEPFTIFSATPTNILSTGGTEVIVIGENFPVENAGDYVLCILFFDGIDYFQMEGTLISRTNESCTMPDLTGYLDEVDSEL